MKEENANSVYEVQNEQAITLLMKDKTRRLLAPFVAEEKSIKEASGELGLKLANYYPYVKRFEAAGLIEVVRALPRVGKAIKRYRSVADEFFIPHTAAPLMAHYEALELANHEVLWRALSKAWLTNTDEVSTWGLRFYKHPEIGFSAMGARSKGEPWDLLSGEGPVTLPYWRRLRLSREKARAMQLELYELLERYTAEQDGQDDYLIRIAMAPLPKADER